MQPSLAGQNPVFGAKPSREELGGEGADDGNLTTVAADFLLAVLWVFRCRKARSFFFRGGNEGEKSIGTAFLFVFDGVEDATMAPVLAMAVLPTHIFTVYTNFGVCAVVPGGCYVVYTTTTGLLAGWFGEKSCIHWGFRR